MTSPPSPLLTTALCLTGLCLLVLGGGGLGLKPEAQADPYTDMVRRYFIDENLLRVNADLNAQSGVPIVDLAPEIYADAESVAFQYAERSFLLSDIRRNDPSLWVIDNGKVTDINPRAHFTPPPFRDRKIWTGEIRFRSSDQNQPNLDLQLVPAQRDAPVVTLIAGSVGGTGEQRPRIVVGGDTVSDVSGAAIDIYCRPIDERPVARVRRIGDQIGIRSDDTSACSLDVAGRSLDSFEAGFGAVGPGERIVVTRREDGRALDYQRRIVAADTGAISTRTASGERARAPELAWWANAVESDFISAFQTAKRIPDVDIITSLDRDIHLQVQRLLDAYLASHPGREGELRIGAVTVMDAMTGEVLAMATAPRAPFSNALAYDADDERARSGRVNQNLQLLPIGSVAKPLMAAAILRRQPNLATLEIPGGSSAASLMGFPLTPPLKNHGASGWVNFDGFIQGSDNRYMASLALLGAEDAESARTCAVPAAEAYRKGVFGEVGSTAAQTTRPKSIFERAQPDGSCVLTPSENPRQLRWADDLNDLFNVNTASRQATQADANARAGNPNPLDCMAGDARFRRYGDGVHDGLPWRDLALIPSANSCRFRESAPLREALGLDAARTFRLGLLPTVLGNGDGLWSTVKVAEAYARLATGFEVQARFTEAKDDSFDDTPLFVLPAGIRAWITHAMSLVTSGTAASTQLPIAADALEAGLARRGLGMGLFAKTGTPIVVQRDYRPVDKAINLLISQDRLRLSTDERSLILHLGIGDRRVASGVDLVGLLDNDTVMIEAARRFGVSTTQVVAALRIYAGQLAESRAPFMAIRRSVGRPPLLVRVADRRVVSENEEDPPEGKLIAFVVAAYDPTAPLSRGHGTFPRQLDGRLRATNGDARPLRAYSVVVSLQYEISGSSNGAADLGGQIFSEVLAPHLLAEVAR